LEEFIRPGFVVKDKNGKEVVDTEAIKKFIEESYKGWYEASKTKEYRRKPNGEYEIDYGKERYETGRWTCP
jgi:hypothetical protein